MADTQHTTEERKEWRAVHRFARISPQKARLIAAMIRGQNCNTALDVLTFSHQRAAMLIKRVLKSAMVMNRLYVRVARVDGGPYYRRFQPKDRGRAHPIAKRTSHLVVQVAER
jgi:large subunit ribosomal protein L22